MKTGTILKQISAFVMALVLCIAITDTTSFAKTKAKPTLSNTTLTVWTNQGLDLSLENASSKVTWKSSNRNLAKIDKTFGKYNQNVSLKTGNKSGTCTIKAKIKNKTYCCKVTVKKGDIVKKYSGKKSKTVLEKVTQSKHSLVIRYKMCAAAHKKCKCPPAAYGNAIRLEKYANGKWSKVPMNVNVVFTCEMHTIAPKTSISKTIHLENYYDVSKLTEGNYRLYVNVYYPNVKDTYVNFKLK